jgi:hypothetical protein
MPGVEDKANYWDGHTLAEHAEWIPRGVDLPVATDGMRSADRDPDSPRELRTPAVRVRIPTTDQIKLRKSYRRIVWICGVLGLMSLGMFALAVLDTSRTYPYQDINSSVFYDFAMALGLLIPAVVAWFKGRALKRYIDAGSDRMPLHMRRSHAVVVGLVIAAAVMVVPAFWALAASGVREVMVADDAKAQERAWVQEDAAILFKDVERTGRICRSLTSPNYRRGFYDTLTESAREWKTQTHDYDWLSATEIADLMMAELDKKCGITP